MAFFVTRFSSPCARTNLRARSGERRHGRRSCPPAEQCRGRRMGPVRAMGARSWASARRSRWRWIGPISRKGQEVREMTRDLDLAKADVDLIAMIVRLRGASVELGADEESAEDSP